MKFFLCKKNPKNCVYVGKFMKKKKDFFSFFYRLKKKPTILLYFCSYSKIIDLLKQDHVVRLKT